MCGGTGDVKQADEEVQAIVDGLTGEINSHVGKTYTKLEAVSYKRQVVAGTNYFIKVNVGDDEHIHVRVFQALPHTGQGPALHGVQTDKSGADPVEYF